MALTGSDLQSVEHFLPLAVFAELYALLTFMEPNECFVRLGERNHYVDRICKPFIVLC